MVYITGDTHGDVTRFSRSSFPDQSVMTKDDIVIICGDFGLVWNFEKETSEEKYWLDWLENKPFTTVFVDGNHECFPRIYEYPEKTWNDGRVHAIRESVLHLIRGEVYTICGKKFFAFGGARSTDITDGILDRDDFSSDIEFKNVYHKWCRDSKMFRVKNVSWWEEELPNEAEMKNGKNNLLLNNNEVDFIITHCLPQNILNVHTMWFENKDIITTYFDEIAASTLFHRWYCGHYHVNRALMDRYIMIYEKIERII